MGRVVHSFLKTYWPERLAAVVAVAGVAISILIHFQVRVWEGYASDFKTMYGSIYSLVHAANAYDFKNIAAVFDANGVVQPTHWYAHSPVYPPFTLALMAPLAALAMVPAIYVWFAICAALLAAALASLARAAGEDFGLGRGWRLAVIGVGAAWPLASFGLLVENVSVVVCSLCVLAFTARAGDRRWLRAIGLAVALLLKPHIAVWVWIAMLLLPDQRGRWIASRGAAVAFATAAVLCLGMAVRGDLGMQVESYRDVLHSELSAGSMSNGNHQLLDIEAEILSLDSLASYDPELKGPATTALVIALLAAAAATLLWVTIRGASARPERFPLIAAWCGLGLLATYHRSHDGLVLLVLLPWLMARVRALWRDPVSWAVFAMLLAMSTGLRWDTWQALAARPEWRGIAEFMLYRQAPCAAFLLVAILLGFTVRTAWRDRKLADSFAPDRTTAPIR